MDMPKPNKLNDVLTARFSEISEQVKKSIKMIFESSTAFEFSHPEPITPPIIHSHPLGAHGMPRFLFGEPLQNINDNQFTIKSERSDEAVSNTSNCNGNIQTIDVDLDDCKQQEVDSVSNSNDSCTNSQVPSLQTNSFEELDFNDDVQEVSVQINGTIKQETDNNEPSKEQYLDDSVALVDSNQNTPTSSVQLNCCDEQDVADVNENIQKAGSETDDVDGNVTPNDSSNNRQTDLCRSGDLEVSTNRQLSSLQTNSSGKFDLLDDIQENSVQANGIIEQEAHTTEPSNIVDNNHFDNENVPTSSVQLNCCDEQLVYDVNENIQMACSQTEDVDGNVTPNDSSNNRHTDVCRSGDFDPNTQITHVDVASNVQNPFPRDNRVLPFEIEDVCKITWPNQQEVVFPPVVELFGQTFTTVMVYGVVTSLNIEQGGLSQRFVIDDGSAAIEVVWKANYQLRELITTLCQLEEELKAFRKPGTSMINNIWPPNSKDSAEMLDNFDKTIHIIKRQITKQTKLKVFGHAAVLGRPFRSPGKDIKLYSEHIEGDIDGNSFELYFKTNLISLYEQTYMPGD